MKKKYYTIALFFLAGLSWLPLSQAQFFVATFEKDNNDLVFIITPNPGGGDIMTGWSDIEFFVRYPDAQAGTFSFGAITVNSLAFPGVSIPNNGADVQGSEVGFENIWLGTSFSPTAQQLYEEGIEYEVFRVAVSIDPEMVDFELVHNEFFSPTYLALISQTGTDLTNGGLKFYGDDAQTCNTCPGPSNNDLLPLPSASVPVTLVNFSAQQENITDARITWQTENEINSAYFELQRGLGNQWEKVGRISASGFSQSPQEYQWLDENASTRLRHDRWLYYRLKMVDADGTFDYSPIRGIAFDTVEQWRVFPNPISPGQELLLQSETLGTHQEVQYRLYNLAGEIVDQWQSPKNSSTHRHLLATTLPAGVYLLQANRAGQIFSQRLVVQR